MEEIEIIPKRIKLVYFNFDYTITILKYTDKDKVEQWISNEYVKYLYVNQKKRPNEEVAYSEIHPKIDVLLNSKSKIVIYFSLVVKSKTVLRFNYSNFAND